LAQIKAQAGESMGLQSVAKNSVEVKTRAGTLCGEVSGDLQVFRGVPFAAPPIGELRFKPPQPLEHWRGVRAATEFAASPMQPPGQLAAGPVSEDCLYLNIWAPVVEGPHPVFVWIFGGGEIKGSPSDPLYDGSNLAARGIVVVNVTYRLGSLGFLKVDHLLGPAYAGAENNALLDIAAALDWVQAEIAAFGGDPGQVTIAGESAGAKNTCSMLGLKAARGKFHGAIVQSVRYESTFTPEQAEDHTATMLAALGIDPAVNAKDLLTVDAAELIAAEKALGTPEIPFLWCPVIDGTVFERTGLDAIRAGDTAEIRLMIGNNLHEYDLFAIGAPFTADPTAEHMSYVNSEAEADQINTTYRRHFPELSDRERRLRLMTSQEWWIPALRMVEAQDEIGGSAWMYRFDWQPTNSKLPVRACHMMELPFVFGTYDSSVEGRYLSGDSADRPALAKSMGDAWAAFIGGRPPGEGLGIEWPSYSTERRSVMVINTESELCIDPESDERQLWSGYTLRTT
jgi:para-nitrobenzyl esterase